MKKARKMGNYVQYLANEKRISDERLAEELGFDVLDVKRLFKGTILLSFPQKKKIADVLDTTIEKLMAGDDDIYRQSVVHCTNPFDQDDNREEILDIIEAYVLISNSQ